MNVNHLKIVVAVCACFSAGLLIGNIAHVCEMTECKSQNESGNAQKIVFLRNPELIMKEGLLLIDGESVQFLDEATGMNEAAVADGMCTQAQVDESSCFNNPFYIRDNGYKLTVPVMESTEMVYIDYLRYEDGFVTVPLSEYLNNELPFLVQVIIDNRVGVRIEEVYVP